MLRDFRPLNSNAGGHETDYGMSLLRATADTYPCSLPVQTSILNLYGRHSGIFENQKNTKRVFVIATCLGPGSMVNLVSFDVKHFSHRATFVRWDAGKGSSRDVREQCLFVCFRCLELHPKAHEHSVRMKNNGFDVANTRLKTLPVEKHKFTTTAAFSPALAQGM